MKEPITRTLFVDGNSLFVNCFEATYKQKWSHPNIHGTYTFLMKVRNQLASGNYNNLRIAFDGNHKGVLRRLIYPDYKKSRIHKSNNRTPEEKIKHDAFVIQKEKLKDYLSHFCNWYEDAKVEGDDVIACYVFNKEIDEKITIMTGDIDVCQLMDKNVDVHYLNKSFKTKTPAVIRYEKDRNRRHMILTYDSFIKYFGFPVENITTLKTFCGDSSDEIKNIYRLGEKTLMREFPELTKKPVTINEILEGCKEGLKDETIGTKRKTVLTNIVNRKTDGVQGKKIIEINKRLVDLRNQEFLSPRCLKNLQNNGFLSNKKYESKDAVGMMKKMQEDGILFNINLNYKNLKQFFKPFKKTII